MPSGRATSFRQLHKIVHQNKTFSAGDGSKRYVASGESRISRGMPFFSSLTDGMAWAYGHSVCPVFRTDERFVLLSLVPLLHWSEENGEYLTLKTTSGGLSQI